MTTSQPEQPTSPMHQSSIHKSNGLPSRKPLPSPLLMLSNSALQSNTVQQNAHPYAIKTTSTGILSRSNSGTAGSPVRAKHRYVPTSPSPSRHKHSKSSVSTVGELDELQSPRPLPIPPALESPTKSSFSHKAHAYPDDYKSFRARRADTLPSNTPAPLFANITGVPYMSTHPPPASPVKLDLADLPPNPKVWTTSQLASYLMNALRISGSNGASYSEGPAIPSAIAKDIAQFVKDARLTGRAFLRLEEKDLEQMGINGLWSHALLTASRTLRQNVVKGRIWGFDADNGEDEEEEDVFLSRSHPQASQPPFVHTRHNNSSSSVSSTSSIDGPGSYESTPGKSAFRRRGHQDRASRVRTMVERFEDSSSGTSEDEHFSADPQDQGVEKTERRISPVTPLMEDLQEIPPEACVATFRSFGDHPHAMHINASPLLDDLENNEKTVQEMLLTEGDRLSHSWGARAWEALDAASANGKEGVQITVKRALPSPPSISSQSSADSLPFSMEDGAMPGEFGESSIRSAAVLGRKSGRTARGGTGSTSSSSLRLRAEDIFARPLPTPPSQRQSPALVDLEVAGDSMHASWNRKEAERLGLVLPTARRECSVQTDEAEEATVDENVGSDVDQQKEMLREIEAKQEKLQETLALVTEYRNRLQDAERRVAELEHLEKEIVIKANSFKDVGIATVVQETKYDPSESVHRPILLDTHSQTIHPLFKENSMQTDKEETLDPPREKFDCLLEGGRPREESEHSNVGDEDRLLEEDQDLSSNEAAMRDWRDLEKWREWSSRAGAGAVRDWQNWDPLENGLSSYVLMVGVGVAAVVLRVLLRRLSGRRS